MKRDHLFRVCSLFIFLSSLTVLGFLIAVSPRGFDISDEGFHLLASNFPMEVLIWPNVAHIYTGLMFNFVGKNIIALRILSELLLFSSASLFFIALSRLVSAIFPLASVNRHFKVIGWSMMCLGALFYYVHFNATPSYNSVNATALNIAAAFLCFSLTYASIKPSTFFLMNAFIAGLFIGITLLVKFPTAIALTVLSIFIFTFWPEISTRSRLSAIGMLLLGIAAWVICHIIALQSAMLLWHTIHSGVTVFLSYGLHKPSHALQHYIPEIINLLAHAITGFWLIFLLLLVSIACMLVRTKKHSSYIMSLYFIILFILASLNSLVLQFYKGGTSNSIALMEVYTGWLFILISSAVFTLFYQKKIASRRLLMLLAMLLFLPFAGAAGTANVITLNLTQYMSSWFAFILILLLVLTNAYHNRWLFLMGSFIVSAFACCQIISAGFIDPYGLNTTIQYQTVPTALGMPTTYLKLDKATNEFFLKIDKMIENSGFRPGDDILAFSDMPGIVFALGGKSPVVPLYSALPNAKTTNVWLLQQVPLARIKKAFILQNEHGIDSMPDFAQLDIQFPTDYILIGQAIWPRTGEWLRLWKAKKFANG